MSHWSMPTANSRSIEERTAELSQVNRWLQEDIAKRETIEEALRDSEERYRLLFGNTPIGIFNYDTQLILTAMNDRFVEFFQSSHEKLQGFDMKTLKDQSVIPAIRKAIGGEEGHYEGLYRATTSLVEIWISMRTAPFFGQDGKVKGGIGIVEDITKRKMMEEALRSLSLTDELTSIHNRRGFFTLADKLLKIAKRQKKGQLLLYADLDGLKEINDTWGHREGDLALMEIANILKATYRESDIVARIGGDEFAVIPVGTTPGSTGAISARLQNSIDTHNSKRKKGYKLSVSWGISYYDPNDPCSIDELLNRADKVMYEQKQNHQQG